MTRKQYLWRLFFVYYTLLFLLLAKLGELEAWLPSVGFGLAVNMVLLYIDKRWKHKLP